jgi:hypothetical protein
MGAMACFGVGSAFQEFTAFRFGDIMHPRTVESAMRPPVADAGAPVTSAGSKPHEPKLNASVASNSNQTISNSNETTARPDQNKPSPSPAKEKIIAGVGAASYDQPGQPVDDVHCLAGGSAAPATGPTRAAVADRSSEDSSPRRTQTATPPGKGQAPDLRRADVPASGGQESSGRQQESSGRQQEASAGQEERGQSTSSRNGGRRAAPRAAADQQATADNNTPTASFGDRRQDRESNRGSSRRRDRTARDSGGAAGAWEREDQESDRTSDRSWGRRGNRYDANREAGDRRVVGRAVREDEGIIVRGPRYGGPMGLFSFGND